MMYLVVPEHFTAQRIDDSFAGSDEASYWLMCTSNLEGAVEWAKTRAKERGYQMRIYKLVESQVCLP